MGAERRRDASAPVDIHARGALSQGTPATLPNRLSRHLRGRGRCRRHAYRRAAISTAQARRPRSPRDAHHDLHPPANALLPLPGGSTVSARAGDRHPRPDGARATGPARGAAVPLHPLAGGDPPAHAGPPRGRPSRALQPSWLASPPPRRVPALCRLRALDTPPDPRRILLTRVRDPRDAGPVLVARGRASRPSSQPRSCRRCRARGKRCRSSRSGC
jgi:hypothetical protein